MSMAKPSGKTQIRILPALHAHLINLAEEEGKSLNSLIETLLAGASRFEMPQPEAVDRLVVAALKLKEVCSEMGLGMSQTAYLDALSDTFEAAEAMKKR